MRRALILFILAMTVALAVPAGAAAGEFQVENTAGTYPIAFSAAATATKMTFANGTSVECTKSTMTGKYTSATTGEVQLTYHGCTYSMANCTSSGQTPGTIVTPTVVFHNIYLEPDKSRRGILITRPASEIFPFIGMMIFTCGGNSYFVGGSMIAELTSPNCGSSGKAFSLLFEKHPEFFGLVAARWQQITTAEARYDLIISKNGAPYETFVPQATMPGAFGETTTITCP
jgi:hypothetical protein